MAERGISSRVRSIWFGPHADPHFAGDLLYDGTRAARRVRHIYWLLLLAAVFALCLVAIQIHDLGPGLLLVFASPLIAALPISLGLRFTIGRRVRAAVDVLNWWMSEIFADWAAIDAGLPPASGVEGDVERGHERLAGRTDDRAIRLRLGLLVAESRIQEARDLLGAWTPADPVERSNRERRLSGLAFQADGIDDLAAAAAAAEGLPAGPDRDRQRVLLAIERARRVSVAGGDSIPILAAARPLLPDSAIQAAVRSFRRRRPLREDPRRIASWILIAALAIFLLVMVLDGIR